MSNLTILCGVDRSGKSTVAEHFKSLGYEYIHMSAPDKKYTTPGYTGPNYCDHMVELLLSFAGRNVVLDRSHYGERIWPYVYGRDPLLAEDDIDVLRELEEGLNVRRILMTDPNTEAHWKRCVDNREPLTRAQFNLANELYAEFPAKYGFEVWTLSTWNEAMNAKVPEEKPKFVLEEVPTPSFEVPKEETMTPEQRRLAYANAVNNLLSKPLIKQRQWPFDEIEVELKGYLNGKLGSLLGQETDHQLSPDDIKAVKEFVRILKAKGKQ
jgi:hypothetical protein